ncbi:hypothetical protein MGG_18096 [Pyricularia oryzae 70-15]|uniref:Uncharacterized protein n=1 Tax=Pyricularia oryzae (strain 70-15 / ATCC MYA-4617 / FGSC 8958) TaxID=242507 RepID=G4NLG7_PYRO7|nr:uncharacterized protein MGG_18096 [Pyricularia oryzae 70-15]EHA46768.1 hypothetical protein MGG_18096 [Pyricularia oryzae 70-15]
MPVVSAPAITGDGGFVQLDTESDRFKHVPVGAKNLQVLPESSDTKHLVECGTFHVARCRVGEFGLQIQHVVGQIWAAFGWDKSRYVAVQCYHWVELTAQLKGPSGLAGLSLVGKASMSWSPIVRLDYGAIAPPCLGPTIRFACLQVPDPWETRQQS